ncbi:MAG: LysR family transcriptional regulator [Pseudomonadota bacterium]
MKHPLPQLLAFKAVLDTGSMTEAAHVLGKSQPAVSNLIARLELDIGLPLFDREKGRLRPTSEALALSATVGQLLSGYRRMEASVEMLKSGGGGHLVLATLPMVGNVLLPKTVARFREHAPDVTVRVQTMESTKVHDALASGVFDLGIAATPFDAASVRIESFSVPCVAILSKSNPIQETQYLSARTLSDVPFVAVMPDRLHYHTVAQTFEKAGVPWNVVCESDSFRIAAEIVSGSDCVAIVDALTALEMSEVLTIRPFHPTISYEFALYRGADLQKRPVVDEFSSVFCEDASKAIKAIYREFDKLQT